MKTTSALAQRWETMIIQNEIAPFSGVLVPHETYRKHSDLFRELDFTKEELRNCLEEKPETKTDMASILTSFLLGFGVAVLISK